MFEEQSWNLTAYSEACYQKWGVRPAPNLVLDEYGGARLLGYTNVVFSNGLLDPWSGGGVIRAKRRTRRHSLIRGAVERNAHGDTRTRYSTSTWEANTPAGSRAADVLVESTGSRTAEVLRDSSSTLRTTIVPNSGITAVTAVGGSVVPSIGSAETGTTVVPNTLTTVVPNVGNTTRVLNIGISNTLGSSAGELDRGDVTKIGSILRKSGESVTASTLNSDTTIKTSNILGSPSRISVQWTSTHTDVLRSSADVLEPSGRIRTVAILDSPVPSSINNFNDAGIVEVPSAYLRRRSISHIKQRLDLPVTNIRRHHISHHNPLQPVSSRNRIYFIKSGHSRNDFFEHFGLKSGAGSGRKAAKVGSSNIGADRTVEMDGSGRRRRRWKRDEGLVLQTLERPYVVVLIPGVPHHLDLRASHLADPPSVTHARLVHKSEIKKWLEAYYTQE